MRLLTIGEAARRLDLAVDTVRRLERDGILAAERTPGGHRRFREDVIAGYARGQRPAAKPVAVRRAALTRSVPATTGTIFDDPLYADEPITDEYDYPEDDDPEDDPADGDDPDGDDDIGAVRTTTTAHEPTRRWTVPDRELEVPKMENRTRAKDEAARLNGYKAHGVTCIPYDVPASWRSKVIAELGTYVTASRFPDWVSDTEAKKIVQGFVRDLLQPQREEAARETQRATLKAQRDAEERTRQKLIEDGIRYAGISTVNGWDETPAEEAREEVEEALRTEVTPTWSQRRVRELVDEILADWEDDAD